MPLRRGPAAADPCWDDGGTKNGCDDGGCSSAAFGTSSGGGLNGGDGRIALGGGCSIGGDASSLCAGASSLVGDGTRCAGSIVGECTGRGDSGGVFGGGGRKASGIGGRWGSGCGDGPRAGGSLCGDGPRGGGSLRGEGPRDGGSLREGDDEDEGTPGGGGFGTLGLVTGGIGTESAPTGASTVGRWWGLRLCSGIGGAISTSAASSNPGGLAGSAFAGHCACAFDRGDCVGTGLHVDSLCNALACNVCNVGACIFGPGGAGTGLAGSTLRLGRPSPRGGCT